MKKNLTGIALLMISLVTIIVLYSFQKSDVNTQKQIGYINKEGKFVPVTDKQLGTFFSKTGHIMQSARLGKIEVAEVIDKETGNKTYRLVAKYAENEFKIAIGSSLKKISETQYALMGKSCSCKTKACSTTAGCDVVSTDPCMCSHCEDCEKTSTNTEEEEIPKFF